MFVNGDLKGKFIMDRNLGARDTKRAVDGTGNLMYQFGRKDPFGNTTSGLTTVSYVGRGELGDDDIWTMEASPGQVAISYGVHNPMIFYSSSNTNWCSGVDSETYLWNDFEEDYTNNGKSIFDPSPKGWKVAHADTWSNFTITTSSSDIYGTMTDWDYTTETMGRSYPRGENPFAYYPSHGYTNSGSPAVISFHSCVIWSSTPASTSQAYYFHMQQELVTVRPTGNGRTQALNIRCVQHIE